MRAAHSSAMILSVIFLLTGSFSAIAETLSFEDAAKVVLSSCGKDIGKYCNKVNLGSGRMRDCLLGKVGVSNSCKVDYERTVAAIQRRAKARVAVRTICDADAVRLCGAVQPGDGHLLECLLTSYRAISARCSQAITDAGYR